MKRYICILIVLAMMVFMLPAHASAAQEETDIVYFEDGSYLVTTISEMQTRATASKNGSKTKTYYESDGSAAWKATLTGTFTYDGSSSTCTSSNCSVTVYNSAWYTISKTASRSGSTANAAVTMGRKLLGVAVTNKSINISLTCDGNGNLS